MPHSPPKLCSRCRKPNCQCRQERRQQSDRERGTCDERGYTWRWRKFKDAYLATNPLCCDCSTKGLVRPAQDVHHIKKMADHPELQYEESNLMALCKSCHSTRTARGE